MKTILLVILALILSAILTCTEGTHSSPFIKVRGLQFEKDGNPYCFLGTNMWYGANVGMEGPDGDRERLIRELDLLKKLNINNLRVLGASEGKTQRNTVNPPIQPDLGQYDEKVLKGLDFLLAEMAKREMHAVIYLNNYWVWSGGMSQYVSWLENETIPNPFLEQYNWGQFMNFSARFYTHEQANQAFLNYIRTLINRKNTITGVKYKNDPTIMSWQLANEPRPGRGEAGKQNYAAFSRWINKTAGFIKSIDPNHLVSTGNEGTEGCIGSAELYKEIHNYDHIDYLTLHLWVLNWGWFNPLNAEETYPEAEKKALAYIHEHVGYAEQLGKPTVLEEFGIPRDEHSYSPDSTTKWRNRYFTTVFNYILENAKGGGPLVGSNFWAWGGFGKIRDPEDAIWKKGDDFTGDPPQEPQGRNSVFATDSATLKIIKTFSKKMSMFGESEQLK